MITLKSAREIGLMRSSAQILKIVLLELEKNVRDGISTKELDDIAESVIRDHKALPSFKNYHGFPASICTSINEEVVHGIPSKDRVLKNGDIISVDVGVKFEGYHSDAARTWAVGNISEKAKKLIEVTEASFFKGIDIIKPGSRLGDLSSTIQDYVEKHNFSVVRDFVGHGIGSNLHEEPQIPNFGTKNTGSILENGMTLAIEPMVNAGTWKVRILENNWTVVTQDNALSAHYENTVAIIEGNVEVLT